MRVQKQMKKFLLLFLSVITLNLFCMTDANAQGAEFYLARIALYTFETMRAVNSMPVYFNQLGKFVISWLKEDDSNSTSDMQKNFATLGDLLVQQTTPLDEKTVRRLTASLFNVPENSLLFPPGSPAVLKTIPNINDLSYSSMLNVPPLKKSPFSPENYIKNASGMTLQHTLPGINWQGPKEDVDKYTFYYNTIMSIQSFNGYVLSNQYANNQELTTAQNNLITVASGSDWISQVATEELGRVLRQILMFQSQNYILQTQLVQMQKQLLTAQVMTNALLILGNQNSEILLVAKAQGVKPTP